MELAFDSLLRGQYGIAHKQKVRNKIVTVVTTPPVDGADIVTTLDVGMQDLAEQALLKELQETQGLVSYGKLTDDVKKQAM